MGEEARIPAFHASEYELKHATFYGVHFTVDGPFFGGKPLIDTNDVLTFALLVQGRELIRGARDEPLKLARPFGGALELQDGSSVMSDQVVALLNLYLKSFNFADIFRRKSLGSIQVSERESVSLLYSHICDITNANRMCARAGLDARLRTRIDGELAAKLSFMWKLALECENLEIVDAALGVIGPWDLKRREFPDGFGEVFPERVAYILDRGHKMLVKAGAEPEGEEMVL